MYYYVQRAQSQEAQKRPLSREDQLAVSNYGINSIVYLTKAARAANKEAILQSNRV